jgi:hypothetical protein
MRDTIMSEEKVALCSDTRPGDVWSECGDTLVLLANHPNVQFHFYRSAIGTCAAEMH